MPYANSTLVMQLASIDQTKYCINKFVYSDITVVYVRWCKQRSTCSITQIRFVYIPLLKLWVFIGCEILVLETGTHSVEADLRQCYLTKITCYIPLSILCIEEDGML